MRIPALVCLGLSGMMALHPATAAPEADAAPKAEVAPKANAAPTTSTATTWTLQECIRTALEKHGNAQAAVNSVTAAQAQLQGAGSALFYPKLSVESRLNEGRTDTGRQAGSISDQQNLLRARVSLWDGGTQQVNVRRARAGETSAQADLQRTYQTLAYDVTSAYIDNLRARRTLAVTERKLAQAQAQKEMVDAKIKAGAAAEVDIYPIEVQIATARVEQIAAANGVRKAALALRTAMGLGAGTVPEIAEMPEDLPEAPSLEECLKLASENRPELRQAQAGIERERASVDLARLRMRPQLNVGGYMDQGVGGTNPLSQWGVDAVVSWSFFDREDRANAAAAGASLRAAEEQQQQLIKDVASEVEQAHLALTSAKERVVAAEASVVMARKNLEAADARYRLGLAIPIEIVDAQVAYSNAELQAVAARYDYFLAQAQLDRAIGREVAA